MQSCIIQQIYQLSCVVQPLQIKYISIPIVSGTGTFIQFSVFYIKFRRLAIFFCVIRCIDYNGIVIFILVKF